MLKSNDIHIDEEARTDSGIGVSLYKLCKLFAEYQVSLGTRLDGPEAINDA